MATLQAVDWRVEFPGLAGRHNLNSAAESRGSRPLAVAFRRYAEHRMPGASGRVLTYAAAGFSCSKFERSTVRPGAEPDRRVVALSGDVGGGYDNSTATGRAF